jgi:tetratricopeptide (TPR) repeat protein
MGELLAELGDERGARRRARWLAAGAVVALPAAAAFGTYRLAAPRARVCGGGAAKVAEVWGPGAGERAGRAFAATGLPYATEAWRQARAALDAYAARWASTYRQVCEATEVRREQSAELRAVRLECLESRRRELGALGRVFGEADAEIVERAAQAARSLAGVEACAAATPDAAPDASPADPAARRELEALRADLAAAGAYLSSGKYRLAHEMASALLDRAGRVAGAGVRAEALDLRGRAELRLGNYGAAAVTFKRAVWAAVEARAEGLEGRAQLNLIFSLAELGHFEAARDWLEFSRALGKRRPEGDPLEVERVSIEGWVYCREGKYERAVALLREALAATERGRDPNPEALALLHNRLGNALGALRRFDESLAHFAREDELLRTNLGAEHPRRAHNYIDRANLLLAAKRHDEALDLLTRALGLGLGPGVPYAVALFNLGEANEGLERYHDALAHYERARQIAAAIAPPPAWLVGNLDARRGRVLARVGRVGEGLALCEEGLRAVQAALPPEHEIVAEALECAGALRTSAGRAKEAVEPLERALAVRQAAGDEERAAVARALLAGARAAAR